MNSLQRLLFENVVLMKRWTCRLKRAKLTIITGLIQPVLWLVLFGQLFSRIMQPETLEGVSYIAFLTAGALVMTVYEASAVGGVELLFDRETKFLERLLAAPVSRFSLVANRFVYLILFSCLQCLLMIATAALLGVTVKTGVGGVLVILLISALFSAGIATVSIILAFVTKNHADFFSIVGFMGLPLMFCSSALIPLSRMPDWLNIIAHINPLTYAIEGIRKLVIFGWDWPYILKMIGVIVAFDLVVMAISVKILRRGLTVS
ncbi:MAG TPA: ABC transporter permease [Paenibacillaceae bacterium]|mgnify:CR=1 FL=1